MAKKEIFLEDAVLDDLSEGLDIIERPITGSGFRVFAWITAALVLLVFFKVFQLAYLKQDFYQSRALANAGQETILQAPRGIIYDRYGVPLVSNEPSFDVNLNLSQILKDKSHLDVELATIAAIVPFNVADIKQKVLATDLEQQAYYPIARAVPLSGIIALKKLNDPAVVIENGFARNYLDGPAFSHILGYIGLVNQSDLTSDPSLRLNDEIGKVGLEKQYDVQLRGVNGEQISFRDARGNIIDEKTLHEPIAGNNIYTTIDAALQQEFYTAMVTRLGQLNRTSGAGIAINPQTGEILSLISMPSFDGNNLTSSLFTDPTRPMFNRAISGLYSPGSTIKPLVAFGALEENIIDPLASIYSPGYLDLPNPYDPAHPSRFLDWRPQGWVNMYSALARSSDVYFYEVGGGFGTQKGMGINMLHAYWEKFDLNKETGIDLPGENAGSLPTPQEKEDRTGQMWRIGDTYNVSIGQGDLVITPLELIRYIAAIANGGKLPTPFIASRMGTDIAHATVVHTPTLTPIAMKDPAHLAVVQQGMLDTVTKDYGTAYPMHVVPMVIAAKTGSAQIQNNTKENAFVVAYAPVPNPTIAIVVLIEDSVQGSLNAVPVAQEVLQWYYDHRVNATSQATSTSFYATTTPTTTTSQ